MGILWAHTGAIGCVGLSMHDNIIMTMQMVNLKHHWQRNFSSYISILLVGFTLIRVWLEQRVMKGREDDLDTTQSKLMPFPHWRSTPSLGTGVT